MHLGKLPSGGDLVHVLRCSVSEWSEHRCSSKGAALAFYTLFSLAPILVLVIAVAGLFYGAQAAQGQLLSELRSLMGEQSAQTIQAILAASRNKQSGHLATLIATALLVVGATTVFAELKDSLDDIWDVPPPKDASVWDTIRTRVLSFGLILVLAFLLMVSLVINAALNVLENYFVGMWQTATTVFSWVAAVLSFLVIAVLFGVIFKLLPRIRLSWRDVVVGALGTAALFVLGKFAIGLYIGHSGVTSTFGAAGSLIAMLLWVYYSAQIFFLGAEFARQYALQLGSLRGLPKEQTGADSTEKHKAVSESRPAPDSTN
ncbi:YihY/virulence factor BrkB family protein [Massilia terrae]|uniref:YihY/virulence factor BrkB family protein n=1 Tax=Massilia terrae TaxID=1811224 RepID=A0ABT2D1Y9_9BURK|nr:YihY/virulence factor BrkB family protein [Massilia terrae]MCS0660212.1 YihY/virulence factor BrkB family protein [Massilia terrae]